MPGFDSDEFSEQFGKLVNDANASINDSMAVLTRSLARSNAGQDIQKVAAELDGKVDSLVATIFAEVPDALTTEPGAERTAKLYRIAALCILLGLEK